MFPNCDRADEAIFQRGNCKIEYLNQCFYYADNPYLIKLINFQAYLIKLINFQA